MGFKYPDNVLKWGCPVSGLLCDRPNMVISTRRVIFQPPNLETINADLKKAGPFPMLTNYKHQKSCFSGGSCRGSRIIWVWRPPLQLCQQPDLFGSWHQSAKSPMAQTMKWLNPAMAGCLKTGQDRVPRERHRDSMGIYDQEKFDWFVKNGEGVDWTWGVWSGNYLESMLISEAKNYELWFYTNFTTKKNWACKWPAALAVTLSNHPLDGCSTPFWPGWLSTGRQKIQPK